MMMIKRYSSYRDSGVEWIGEIPREWDVTRLKYSTKINMGQSPKSEFYGDDGIGFPFLQGNSEFGEFNPTNKLFTKEITKKSSVGDILFSVRGSVGEINWSDIEYCIGRGLCSITPIELVDKYLWYYLHNSKEYFLSISVGSTFVSVNTDDIKNHYSPLPPLNEQKQIVEYLDENTSSIDTLIQSKEKKISLLKEKRTSLINKVVTKGLNPDVEMKDSGVEWIGEIPIHWEVIKTYIITKNLDGKRVPLNSEQRGNMEGHYPYWGSNGVVDYINDYIFDEEIVLVGEDGSPFFDKYKPVSFFVNEKVWVNNHIHILKTRDRIIPKYLTHSFNVVDYKEYISGSTRDKLTQTDLSRIPHCVPPISEQKQIVQYLDRETELIDKTVSIEHRKIELLKEYKQSLISEVITGKRKVVSDE
jgi:type I restriction enzyme S subunit